MNMETETIDGYLVSDKMKRVWRTQMEILRRFDTVCKEYNLRYYADFGTLLGAIRHKGYIPWDDDIDVTMPRPDYARLCEIGKEVFSEPYFFQNYYTEHLFVSTFSRIRDSRTAMIEQPVSDYPAYNQGIFIDIWPLDIAPTEQSPTAKHIVDIAAELWGCTLDIRSVLRRALTEQYQPLMGIDTLLDIAEMDKEERLRTFEGFMLSNYERSDAVNVFPKVFHYRPCYKKWYETVIMLPFEDTMIPAPVGYDELLKTYYGDYMEPVMFASDHHVKVIDPDRSYSEYS